MVRQVESLVRRVQAEDENRHMLVDVGCAERRRRRREREGLRGGDEERHRGRVDAGGAK
jgi:hypothetical protein